MTIAEMHYDFKMKLNKLDSKQHRNFLIPEVDWLLNEGQELFVKMVAHPRMAPNGFETHQRSIDDIRVLVSERKISEGGRTEDTLTLDGDAKRLVYKLPENYWHFLTARIRVNAPCGNGISCVVRTHQQDDVFDVDPYERSSFRWREYTAVFQGDRLVFNVPEDLPEGSTHTLLFTFVRKPQYMHYAEGWSAKGYTMPDSRAPLRGKADCELPFHTHREIVDLAVFCASEQLGLQSFQSKFAKLQLHQLTKL